MKWQVYILECSDHTFYIGHTHDLSARLRHHSIGTGAAHTALHAPTALLYHESFATEIEAVRREGQLKRWSHSKKQALVDGDTARLRRLSQSHDHVEQEPST